MIAVIIYIVTIATCVYSTPLPPQASIKYDQRQDGEINVRADLENFVILVIPTTSTNLGLLDLLAKTVPIKSLKRRHHVKHHDSQETQTFIESKTAPYHVDISKSDTKLQPQVEKNEEILMSRSKSEEKRELGRFAKAYIVSMPSYEKERTLKELEESETSKITEKLLLLGAENEQCGPEMTRDELGICRPIKRL